MSLTFSRAPGGRSALPDAGPLTPMEQQIISSVAADATLAGSAVPDDKVDADPADEMLDDLVTWLLRVLLGNGGGGGSW